jgi:cobalamin synthase
MPYITLLLIVCCAVFYYRVGEQEYGSGGLLALVSVTLWAIGILASRLGWLGNLLLQVGLFFALTVWNMRRPPLNACSRDLMAEVLHPCEVETAVHELGQVRLVSVPAGKATSSGA